MAIAAGLVIPASGRVQQTDPALAIAAAAIDPRPPIVEVAIKRVPGTEGHAIGLPRVRAAATMPSPMCAMEAAPHARRLTAGVRAWGAAKAVLPDAEGEAARNSVVAAEAAVAASAEVVAAVAVVAAAAADAVVKGGTKCVDHRPPRSLSQ
jgi:hypothetical protein